MNASAAIFGCEGLRLSDWEAGFFAEAAPWGFILFARNIESAEQLRALTGSLRTLMGRDAPIFIDQEGGRVARLRPPLARAYPPADIYGRLHDATPDVALEACRLGHRLIAAELRRFGVDADCAPCCDLRVAGASDVIGDRAFHEDPAAVAALARAAAEGLMEGGAAPVIKHIPGHGRADVDSHHALPRIPRGCEALTGEDYAVFRALADMPMAMTAHIIIEDADADAPVTCSPSAMAAVVRGAIGYDGLVMTDDLSMKALDGPFEERVRRSYGAGCDVVLHCNGERAEMAATAKALRMLEGRSFERAQAAEAARLRAEDFDEREAEARWRDLIGALWTAPEQAGM